MVPSSTPVLIVDDDAAVRSALKFALEAQGLEVRLYDSSAALLAETNLPARGCLVIDYRMPGMDGVLLVDSLRARGVDLPAILISGRVTRGLRELAAKSGIDRVLEKPLSGSALIDGIRAVLKGPASAAG